MIDYRLLYKVSRTMRPMPKVRGCSNCRHWNSYGALKGMYGKCLINYTETDSRLTWREQFIMGGVRKNHYCESWKAKE